MSAGDYSTLRADLWLRLLPPLLAAGVAAGVAAGIAWRLGWRIRRLRIRLGESGTTELETAMALPFFLVTVLITIQSALLLNANLVVDYAAFCAARSAAVWIPSAVRGEEANTLAGATPDSSEKVRRAHTAAAIALIPISPRASTFRFGLIPRSASVGGEGADLRRLADAVQANIRSGVSYGRLALDLVDKWPYATWATNVSLRNGAGAVVQRFDAGGPVSARVVYKFEMAVPFAGQVLGAALGERYFGWLGGYFVPVAATYTLASWPH